MRREALYPEEIGFRFDRWVAANCLVYEQSGEEWIVDCPRCNRDKLAVNVSLKAFQCFTCGFASWHPARLVAEVLGVDLQEAIAIAAQDASGIPVGPVAVRLEEPRPPRADTELPTGSFPFCLGPLTDDARYYLQRRGVSDEHAEFLGARSVLRDHWNPGSKADQVLTSRILFPVWNSVGRPVFWAARAIWASDAKVVNMPRPCRRYGHDPGCTCTHQEWGLPPVPYAAGADEVILGLHGLRAGNPAIVVEGVTDVAVCGPGFVATLGSHVSPAQARLIAGTGVSEAILLFDGDQAGAKGVKQAKAILEQYLPTRAILCPPGEDPGSLGRRRAIDRALCAPLFGELATLHLPTTKIAYKVEQARKPIINPLKGP